MEVTPDIDLDSISKKYLKMKGFPYFWFFVCKITYNSSDKIHNVSSLIEIHAYTWNAAGLQDKS